MNKMCTDSPENVCIARHNKDSRCCKDDIEDITDIILPAIDRINDTLNTSNSDDCKLVLSKLVYVLTIMSPQSIVQVDIINKSKEGCFLCYHSLDESLYPLVKALALDILKWLNYTLFDKEIMNEVDFLISLNNDVETINNFTRFDELNDSCDLDDLFF